MSRQKHMKSREAIDAARVEREADNAAAYQEYIRSGRKAEDSRREQSSFRLENLTARQKIIDRIAHMEKIPKEEVTPHLAAFYNYVMDKNEEHLYNDSWLHPDHNEPEASYHVATLMERMADLRGYLRNASSEDVADIT